MTDCIFCDIAGGRGPAHLRFEDEAVVAFDDIHPAAPVHILVIPRQHIQSIAHLDAGSSDVIAKLIYAAKRIATEQGLEGYKIVFNVGRAAGQLVDHLHLHLLGGWEKPEDGRKGLMI